jgi:hypothetical protein
VRRATRSSRYPTNARNWAWIGSSRVARRNSG